MQRALRSGLLCLTSVLVRASLAISSPGIFAEALARAMCCDRRFRIGGIDKLEAQLQRAARTMELPQAHRQDGYSQEGEDLVLARLFEGRTTGFYVDVGAHHPARFSNTYLLYRKGWRGINIDAMPGAMAPFRRLRPDDINLEMMVSSDPTPRTFFLFDEPALNTASEEVLRMREAKSPQHRVIRTVTMTPKPLSLILSEHVPEGRRIDLMNIDVEGLDVEVLASNDWERFQPEVIVAEILSRSLDNVQESELYRFLAPRGYRLTAKLFNSAIFQRAS